MAPPNNDNTHQAQPGAASPGSLSGKRIAVGLSGGIACYKTATLVSRLVQQGADVRVMMTEAATRFVGPLTFQSLSGKPVLTSIWQADDHPDSQHVGVARWCDLLVIAPATANLIAKLAHGLTDDVVSLVACALPASTPLLIAPAMNADMWASPIVQKNVATLDALDNVTLIGPESGWQACRTEGAGRMSEPEAILETIVKAMNHEGAKGTK
jgi:phosphopantothenoylcysteine decarboxylase/phosphopantothenate--cysteine ligase